MQGKITGFDDQILGELESLVPGAKRVAYVWFYENVTPGPQRQPVAPSDGR